MEEQKHALSKRRGNTLSRRSILKSYKPAHAVRHNALHLEGVADIRKVSTLPIYTIGSCTVQVHMPLTPEQSTCRLCPLLWEELPAESGCGCTSNVETPQRLNSTRMLHLVATAAVPLQGIRNLMSQLGARPGGNMHVVVTDLREELAVYINGRPYLRRELEMPSAALHHAGQTCSIAALSCLHVPSWLIEHLPCRTDQFACTTCAGVHAVKLEELERRLRNDLMHEAMAWGGRLLLHREISVPKHILAGQLPGKRQLSEDEGDDITQKEDMQPDAAVAAFWESTGLRKPSAGVVCNLFCSV